MSLSNVHPRRRSPWHFHVVQVNATGKLIDAEKFKRRRECWQRIARWSRWFPDSTWAVRRCDCGRRIGGL